jgi:drug/metabolite transporter (DMT)-like permease
LPWRRGFEATRERGSLAMPRPQVIPRGSAPAADRIGLLYAVLAAVGFSFKAILVKLAYRYGVDAETLLALRMAFSLPFFALLGWIGTRRASTRLTRRDGVWLFGLGLLGYYLAS